MKMWRNRKLHVVTGGTVKLSESSLENQVENYMPGQLHSLALTVVALKTDLSKSLHMHCS